MAKFGIIFMGELEDDVFDTKEEAYEHASYLASCSNLGAEILEMSNPGDYPMDEYEEPDYEVIELDEDD